MSTLDKSGTNDSVSSHLTFGPNANSERTRGRGNVLGLNTLISLILLLSCVPLAHMLYLLFTVGGNCIGNDYVHWIKLIDSALSGTLSLADYTGGAFMGSHFCFFSVLLEIILCKLSIWNVRLECLIGMTMLLISTILLWNALVERNSGRWKFVLLSALLAINFGASQSSVLLHSMFSLRLTGLCQLGLTVGFWALVKLRDRHRTLALALMGLGGIVASYSCGAALSVWSVLFFTMMATGYRRWKDIAAFAGAFSIGLSPYAYFLLIDRRSAMSHSAAPDGSFMNPIELIDLIGRPLCNDIGFHFGRLAHSEMAATFGIVALALLLTLRSLMKFRLSSTGPALALMSFSWVAAILLIGVRFQIAPWYAAMMKYFWIGLVAIAISMLRQSFHTRSLSPALVVARVVSSVTMLGWMFLFVTTNWSYDDKQFYLAARSPASESFQRHYLTAPTYGDDLLFQWQPGNQRFSKLLGSVLYRHGLLCFGKEQEWALQGDYLLHDVSFNESVDCPEPKWIIGTRIDRAKSWRDYHHLNLCLGPTQKLEWTVQLPARVDKASFHTSCEMATSRSNAGSASLIGNVTIGSTDPNTGKPSFSTFGKLFTAQAKSLSVDVALERFAGQRVSISFACERSKIADGTGSVVFAYPRLDITAPVIVPSEEQIDRMVPENTDTSPVFPKLSAADLTPNMVPSYAVHADCGGVPLRSYSHIFVEAVPDADEAPQLLVKLNLSGFQSLQLNVPMLLDKQEHGYTYDLKTLQLPAVVKLQSVDVTLAGMSDAQYRRSVISQVRILKAFQQTN